jgi:hypothetical protein
VGKYDPLRRHLLDSGLQETTLSFDDIAAMVDGGLPPAAYDRGRRMWWSNTTDRHHVQAVAWQAAGYVVASGGVDYAQRTVTFVRSRSCK